MLRKKCPSCGQVSFSATAMGAWKCPQCGHDLTEVQSSPAPRSS